jgi:hypothetical protein
MLFPCSDIEEEIEKVRVLTDSSILLLPWRVLLDTVRYGNATYDGRSYEVKGGMEEKR